MSNPEGMNASLKEASKPTLFLSAPTVAQTIRRKGYNWQKANAIKKRLRFKETTTEGCLQLQIGCLVYVCFT